VVRADGDQTVVEPVAEEAARRLMAVLDALRS
jgi:hypothetical protein